MIIYHPLLILNICGVRYTYSENIISFVNNVKTGDGGSHEVGFKTALTKVFNEYIKEVNGWGDIYRYLYVFYSDK